ncbi:MAG: hypothetical protein J7516_14735 [Shinella sp.]|jgi:hypothetical protein|nr:hypothetical protein [Shinella sp.]
MSKTLIRFAALATTALFLAGCQTAAEVRANDENKCRAYGFRPNTDAFAECLQRIDLDRRADFRAARMDPFLWNQPTVIYVHGRRH